MDLDSLTLGDLKKLRCLVGDAGNCTDKPLMPKVGEDVFIKTATYFYVGKVAEISGGFARLEQAAWVAETGRFSVAMKTGDFSEVETFPDNIHPRVNLGSAGIIWANWPHALPRISK